MSDNDPKHTSGLAKEYMQENFMQTLDWPTYSPDLNPMENIWSWLKREVSKDLPENMSQLKNSLLRHFKRIIPEFIKPYIEGMEGRFKGVSERKGNYINH